MSGARVAHRQLGLCLGRCPSRFVVVADQPMRTGHQEAPNGQQGIRHSGDLRSPSWSSSQGDCPQAEARVAAGRGRRACVPSVNPGDCPH